MTAAFALHTWLGLPIWTVPVFLVFATALLIMARVRTASARTSPY
jgi:Flp pilus assembly protein TadB